MRWVAATWMCLSALGQDALTPEDFRKLHESLTPKAQAKWQTIGWKTGLLEARATAIQSGKPLFMWAMDGHPMGCT